MEGGTEEGAGGGGGPGSGVGVGEAMWAGREGGSRLFTLPHTGPRSLSFLGPPSGCLHNLPGKRLPWA